MSGYRYYDEQRSFDEALREIEVIENFVPEPDYGGLERIARGETALAKMANMPAPPPIEQEQKKQELKTKLKALLTEKQQRELNKQLKVACFIEHAKLADFSDPGGLIGLRQPGDGLSNDEPKQPERRHEGVHQGPAANLLAKKLKELRQEEQARKVAASRLDKEVQKGTVSYADTSPFIPKGMPVARQKEVSREIAAKPARVPMKSLLLRRKVQQARYNNKQLSSEKARAAGAVAPRDPKGLPPLDSKGRIFDRPDKPIAYNMGRDEINVPSTSGQTTRASVQKGRAPGRKDTLPKKRGVDKTLNMHALTHEEGEREAFSRGLRQQDPMHIHSGHIGTRPVVAEKNEVIGDPKAQRIAKAYRNIDSDDQLVGRLAKQVGDHPDSPIQVGSRKERALQKLLERNKHKLDPRVTSRAAENLAYWKEMGLSSVKVPTAVQRLRKLAASRLDKEVKAGRMTYAQAYPSAVPGMYEQFGGTEQAKGLARGFESAATEVAPERLARTRQLNGALYRNRMAIGGEGHTALIPMHVPGQGPANYPVPFARNASAAFVPSTSGQWLRTMEGGAEGQQRALQGTVFPSLLLPAQPVDQTLNRATMEHELGEGAARVSNAVHPHATHMGVTPITREGIALQGDPEAQKVFSRLRAYNPDDVLVQKAMKQVGAHPDRPLAVGGRQQAAVERLLAKKRDQLTPQAHALGAALVAKNTVFGSKQRVETLPSALQQEAAGVGQAFRDVPGALRQGSPLQRVRNLVQNTRTAIAKNNAFSSRLKGLLAR